MGRKRVVVTGIGVVAPNGIGVDAFWKANREGRSGIGKVTSFDTRDFPCWIAGEVRDFRPADYMPEELAGRVDRFVHFALACGQMALASAKLDPAGCDPERVGVIVGSGLGGQLFHEEQMVAAFDRGAHRMNPLCVPRIAPNAAASHLGIRHGFKGPNLALSTACASGAHAIGEALRKIQYGEADVCLAGGVEAPLTRFTFGAYCALRVMSKRNESPEAASRPFDRGRDGFVMSEGGAVLVLEERERAIARGAPILAELAGYACNSGAHHMVMPDPAGADACRAMTVALRDAGLSTVDHINAHATSTKANDVAETRAIKAVFGPRARSIPVTATKSMIGHSIGAAGAIEAAVSVLTLRDQFVPPIVNLEEPGEECDLDYVAGTGRPAPVRSVLSNSFGFGNCNAALIFVRAD
jgi:3-oxoacyl-[acyl-carrier-protein] synthase II